MVNEKKGYHRCIQVLQMSLGHIITWCYRGSSELGMISSASKSPEGRKLVDLGRNGTIYWELQLIFISSCVSSSITLNFTNLQTELQTLSSVQTFTFLYGLQGFWNFGIYGFRDLGIYGFMDLWIYGFKDLGIQGFKDLGVYGFGD